MSRHEATQADRWGIAEKALKIKGLREKPMKKGFRMGSLFQFIDKSMAEGEGFEDAFKIKLFLLIYY